MSTVSDELALFRPIVRERWNTEPNPRPHMRFVSKALFLRVPACTKWPFCYVKSLGWVGVGLR